MGCRYGRIHNMAIIYITENLYNKERGIMPCGYIGRDQTNNTRRTYDDNS